MAERVKPKPDAPKAKAPASASPKPSAGQIDDEWGMAKDWRGASAQRINVGLAGVPISYREIESSGGRQRRYYAGAVQIAYVRFIAGIYELYWVDGVGVSGYSPKDEAQLHKDITRRLTGDVEKIVDSKFK